jgi:hypothetical protein
MKKIIGVQPTWPMIFCFSRRPDRLIKEAGHHHKSDCTIE